MNRSIGAPKPYPCASCPYRCDVPSGVWAEEEYAKLPEYDNETAMQPLGVFCCHQDDDRICSGWAGTHDGNHLLSLRMAAGMGAMTPETLEATLAYESPVPLFASGEEAAEHGLKEVRAPSDDAQRIMLKVTHRRGRRGQQQRTDNTTTEV